MSLEEFTHYVNGSLFFAGNTSLDGQVQGPLGVHIQDHRLGKSLAGIREPSRLRRHWWCSYKCTHSAAHPVSYSCNHEISSLLLLELTIERGLN